MKKVGKTTDGKSVFAGAFRMVDEKGVPLDMVIEHLAAKNAVVDWADFIRCATSAGWTWRGIVARIDEALIDSGNACRQEVVARAKLFLTNGVH